MSDLSPSTQFDRLFKPLFVHGLLHQLCLQQMIQSKSTTRHLVYNKREKRD